MEIPSCCSVIAGTLGSRAAFLFCLFLFFFYILLVFYYILVRVELRRKLMPSLVDCSTEEEIKMISK